MLGLVSVRGDVLPVADMRRRFGLAPRPVHPDDHLVIARTPDGLLLVHDLDRFLALDEEAVLQQALEGG